MATATARLSSTTGDGGATSRELGIKLRDGGQSGLRRGGALGRGRLRSRRLECIRAHPCHPVFGLAWQRGQAAADEELILVPRRF